MGAPNDPYHGLYGLFKIEPYETLQGARSESIADFNNDGQRDLATANYSSNSVSVLLGNADYQVAVIADPSPSAATLAKEHGKEVSIHIFGQEVQPETYAISKADLLLSFLKQHTCDYLYLAGDILDGWKLHRGFHAPVQALFHTDQHLLSRLLEVPFRQ